MPTRQQRRAAARAEAKRTRIYIGTDHPEPTRICPVCRAVLHRAFCTAIVDVVKDRIQPGDITLCAHCTAMLRVQDDGTLRAASQAEFETLPEILRRLATVTPGRLT